MRVRERALLGGRIKGEVCSRGAFEMDTHNLAHSHAYTNAFTPVASCNDHNALATLLRERKAENEGDMNSSSTGWRWKLLFFIYFLYT